MSIVENSVLARLLLSLRRIPVLTALTDSAAVRLFLALGQALARAWRQSALCRRLDRGEAAARTWAGQSAVCRALAREGLLTRAWPDSLFCRAAAGAINLPYVLAGRFYRPTKRVWDGSVCFRALSAAGGVSWLLLGLVFLVMLCVPHALWNNLYGFLGVLVVTAAFLAGTRRRFQVERLGPYMVLYMGFICYGLIASFSVALSLRFFLFHLTCFLIVLLVVSGITRYRQLQLLVALAGAGLLAAALYGCYQGVTGVEIVASQQDQVLNAGMPGRVYSFFDNPNNFAEILVMLIPLMLALLWNARTKKGRVLALLVLGASVISIGFTYGRSGWIGLTLAVVIFFAFRNWRLVPILLVLGVLAVPFLPQTIYNRILTIGNMQDTSTSYRFDIFESMGNLLRDFGLRGVGLGNDVMRQIFTRYPKMWDGNYPVHAHNNYLQMWAEVGFLGLLAYLGTIFGNLKAGVRAYVSGTDRRVKVMLAAAISAMCGILVVSLAEYTWFYPRNMFLFWFLFAVIAACVKLVHRQEKEEET